MSDQTVIKRIKIGTDVTTAWSTLAGARYTINDSPLYEGSALRGAFAGGVGEAAVARLITAADRNMRTVPPQRERTTEPLAAVKARRRTPEPRNDRTKVVHARKSDAYAPFCGARLKSGDECGGFITCPDCIDLKLNRRFAPTDHPVNARPDQEVPS